MAMAAMIEVNDDDDETMSFGLREVVSLIHRRFYVGTHIDYLVHLQPQSPNTKTYRMRGCSNKFQ